MSMSVLFFLIGMKIMWCDNCTVNTDWALSHWSLSNALMWNLIKKWPKCWVSDKVAQYGFILIPLAEWLLMWSNIWKRGWLILTATRRLLSTQLSATQQNEKDMQLTGKHYTDFAVDYNKCGFVFCFLFTSLSTGAHVSISRWFFCLLLSELHVVTILYLSLCFTAWK